MGYKLIACDIDETLLDDNHQCPQVNIDAINRARQSGVKFVLASGRGYAMMQNQLELLGLKDLENEYTISFNGGVITENLNNSILTLDSMYYDKVNSIFDFGVEKNLCIHIYTPDLIYAFNMDDVEYDFLTSKGIPVIRKDENDMSFLEGETIIKILYFNNDLDYLKSLEKDMKHLLDDVELTYSSNRFMEFNYMGINKGFGVSRLAKLLKIDIKDIMVIGDNDNDISMMKLDCFSVAANNASEHVKEICDYVTQSNNNEGVVAEAINKFIFNEDF